MNFFQKWGQKLRDDEGWFQGGERGRLFGRFQDKVDALNQGYKDKIDARGTNYYTPGETGPEGGYGTDLSRAFNIQDAPRMGVKNPDQNVFTMGDQRMSHDFSTARQQALHFDPTNPNEVREMQLNLIKAGYLPDTQDAEGNYVAADSMFGPQTESALKLMQGHMPASDPTGAQGMLDYALWSGNKDLYGPIQMEQYGITPPAGTGSTTPDPGAGTTPDPGAGTGGFSMFDPNNPWYQSQGLSGGNIQDPPVWPPASGITDVYNDIFGGSNPYDGTGNWFDAYNQSVNKPR